MMHHMDDPDGDDESVPRDLGKFLTTLKRRLAARDPNGWMQCASLRRHRARRCIEPTCAARRPRPDLR